MVEDYLTTIYEVGKLEDGTYSIGKSMDVGPLDLLRVTSGIREWVIETHYFENGWRVMAGNLQDTSQMNYCRRENSGLVDNLIQDLESNDSLIHGKIRGGQEYISFSKQNDPNGTGTNRVWEDFDQW